MNKVKELRIDSTLWATPAKIVNLLDFKPEKLKLYVLIMSRTGFRVNPHSIVA